MYENNVGDLPVHICHITCTYTSSGPRHCGTETEEHLQEAFFSGFATLSNSLPFIVSFIFKLSNLYL